MKGFGEDHESNLKSNKSKLNSQEQIVNHAIQLHVKGNIPEATKYYQNCIEKGIKDCRVFSNYGLILRDYGKLQEAASFISKAIEINPNLAEGYSNLGIILKELGELQRAKLSFFKAIEINPNYANAYSNLGGILKNLGESKEAELYMRKAIELNPNSAEANSNIGSLLIDLGKFKEAELYIRKAIEINPNLAKAYYSLSLFEYSDKNKILEDNLFSKSILSHNIDKDKIPIYFARANILHKKSKFKDSSKYLKLANNIKLKLNESNLEYLINKSSQLLFESEKKTIKKKDNTKLNENIFIVGIPRSGSTLIESIISMNKLVYSLGEINTLEEVYIDYKNNEKEMNLSQLYEKKIKQKTHLNITTNKWLYNYQYAGIICNLIPNCKIIHCQRNPLDNILSIYRANFEIGNTYSSSLEDSTKIYLNHMEVMEKYKKKFGSKIYELNYDKLVKSPHQEIQLLISWLGWKWNDLYLQPHLNKRSVSTMSNIAVRSPINSKSIGGWKNYKEMLKPAIKILSKEKKYKDFDL